MACMNLHLWDPLPTPAVTLCLAWPPTPPHPTDPRGGDI